MAETVYTVGVLNGAPWEVFGDVKGVAFDATGTLFVLDADPARVVAFDPSGKYLRTISSEGEGPGELGHPVGLVVLPGGQIGVQDYATFAIHVYDTEGRLLESARYDPLEGLPSPSLYAIGDRDMVSVQRILGPASRTQGRPVARFRLDGSHELFYMAWDTPRISDGDGETIDLGSGTIHLTGGTVAFPPPLAIDVLRSGLVVLADSIGYRVKLLDSTGNVVRMLTRDVAPIPVTEHVRREERRHRFEMMGSYGAGLSTVSFFGAIDTDPGALEAVLRDRMERQIAMLEFPEKIPVIAELAVDWNDRIWIRRSAFPGDMGATDLLTADGAYLGTISAEGIGIPEAFGPDNLMAYVEVDDFGVERVRVSRFSMQLARLCGSGQASC